MRDDLRLKLQLLSLNRHFCIIIRIASRRYLERLILIVNNILRKNTKDIRVTLTRFYLVFEKGTMDPQSSVNAYA